MNDKSKLNMLDKEAVKKYVSEGIDIFCQLNGWTTDYQAAQACGFASGNSIVAIRESGNVTVSTLAKLGSGAEYKGDVKKVVAKVWKDFGGVK